MSSLAWQTLPLKISPIAFSVGKLAIRWYSLGYLAAFLSVMLLIKWRFHKKEHWLFFGIAASRLQANFTNILFFSFLGLLLGGRLGYALFYDWQIFFQCPLAFFSPFDTRGNFIGFYGMSFHGGLIGAVIAAYLAAKFYRLPFDKLLNFTIPAIPFGYTWGRLGNFFNGELYGRTTSYWGGMYFPADSFHLLRHPTPLYEALGEGILIFLILWPRRNSSRWFSLLFPFFLVLYGSVRFWLEFYRQPIASQIIRGNLTESRLFCLIMMLGGFFLIIKSFSAKRSGQPNKST